MQGFITETELTEANREFPGIVELLETLPIKPRTFLELVARYDHWCDSAYRQQSSLSPRTR